MQRPGGFFGAFRLRSRCLPAAKSESAAGNSACAGWEDLRGEIDDLLQLAWLFVAMICTFHDSDREMVVFCEAEGIRYGDHIVRVSVDDGDESGCRAAADAVERPKCIMFRRLQIPKEVIVTEEGGAQTRSSGLRRPENAAYGLRPENCGGPFPCGAQGSGAGSGQSAPDDAGNRAWRDSRRSSWQSRRAAQKCRRKGLQPCRRKRWGKRKQP